MARLNSYYTLCPLIDQENLLGVEADSSPGCAIVTLGRNIVIRYKLQELKQISSWSSKEHLTTQVIFDETTNNYVAVFNEKNIRMWEDQETNLDSVKKYKFSSSIHTILTFKKIPPVLVMANGATVSLKWALKNTKEWKNPAILLPDEKISRCQLVSIKDKIYFCALTKLDNTHNYLVVPLIKENYSGQLDQLRRIKLKQSSEKMVGHVVMQDESNAYLLTLWSHGQLYSYSLITPTMDSFPGSLISVITVANTKYPVAMVALNESTIAAYGADVHEEGAVLFIYNIQFQLVQAVQKLKLFTMDAKLWKVEDKLLLAANRHLVITPYCLAHQRIEGMLGSTLHFSNNDVTKDNDIVVIRKLTVANWGADLSDVANYHPPINDLKSNIATKISTFLLEGISDAAIQLNLIPELIEAKDIPSILWCLDHLNDLPEELLIQLLRFCLSLSNTDVTPIQNGLSSNPDNNENTNAQNKLLNKILNICCTDISLTFHLKARLNFDEILKLLDYLTNKLHDDGSLNNNCVSYSEYKLNGQLYEWTKLLIDSHYQHYLLSQDPKVIDLLNKLNEILGTHLQLIKDLENLRPMIQRLKCGKLLKSIPNDVNRFYSIEKVKLY